MSPLEKTLRRSVRAEVRASPALWDAYRRRRTPWWRKALSIILALACLNFLPIGLVLMPVSLSFALAAPVIKPHFVVPDAALQGSRITMALAALFLTGSGLMGAAASNALNALGRQTSAWLDIKATGPAAFAFLPVRDRPHWFMPVRDLLLFGVCVTWLGLPAYAAVGWANQLSVFQWVAAALLLGLQPLMLAAALVLGTIAVPRFFSSPATHIVGALAWLASMFAGLSLAQAPPAGALLVAPLFLILPSGWVNAAIEFGLIEGHAAGWLFLVPVVAAIALASRRLGGEVREFAIDGLGRVRPVFDDTAGYPAACFAAPLALAETASQSGPSAVGRNDIPDAVEEIQRRAFLAPRDWASLGWIERMATSGLGPRERTVLESLHRSRPWWTRQWVWMCMVLAVVAAIVPGWLVHAEWWIPLAGLHALRISQVGLRSKPEETLGMMSGLIAALPVSFDEIASLRARVWFRQAISCLGPLAAFGWLVAWRQGVSPLDGLLQVATTFLLYGAGVLLGTCLQVSLGTNDSARLGMLLLWSIGAGAVGVGTFIVVLLSPYPNWNFALASGCLILSFAFWRLYRRIFNRGEIDLIGRGTGARP